MKRFELLLYAQQFAHQCVPIYALYVLMFSERSGLSTGQISILFGLWTLVAVVSELPTGALADRFSRRNFIIYGKLLEAVAFTIWIIQPTFGAMRPALSCGGLVMP